MSSEVLQNQLDALNKIADVPEWCCEFIGYIALDILGDDDTEIDNKQLAFVSSHWTYHFLDAVQQDVWPEGMSTPGDFYQWLDEWSNSVEADSVRRPEIGGIPLRNYLGFTEVDNG